MKHPIVAGIIRRGSRGCAPAASGGANSNAQDLKGWASLHLASFCERQTSWDIVGTLLKDDANANAQDKEGRSPLHLASFLSEEEVVRLLLESGNVDAQDNEGNTALHLASSRGGGAQKSRSRCSKAAGVRMPRIAKEAFRCTWEHPLGK